MFLQNFAILALLRGVVAAMIENAAATWPLVGIGLAFGFLHRSLYCRRRSLRGRGGRRAQRVTATSTMRATMSQNSSFIADDTSMLEVETGVYFWIPGAARRLAERPNAPKV